MRGGEHQAAEPGAGAAAAGIGDALDRKRGILGGKRVLLQPLGRNFGVVEQVEIADRSWRGGPGRQGPGTGSSGETRAMATARSASVVRVGGRGRRDAGNALADEDAQRQCRRSPRIRSPRPCRAAPKRCSTGPARRPHRPRRRRPSWPPRPGPRRGRRAWRHRGCYSWDFPGIVLAERNLGVTAFCERRFEHHLLFRPCLVQWVRAKVAWRRARAGAFIRRASTQGRWHGCGGTDDDLFRSPAAARRRGGHGAAVQAHRPRHHPRLSRRRHRHRPGGAADHRRRSDPPRRRTRHRLPAVHHRAGDQAVAAMGAAARDLRARAGAGAW